MYCFGGRVGGCGKRMMRSVVHRGLLVAALHLAAATHALAQSEDGLSSGEPRTVQSAQAGMFLPYSIAPRTDTQRAFAFVLGGYDTPREHGQLEGTADVTLVGPLA